MDKRVWKIAAGNVLLTVGGGFLFGRIALDGYAKQRICLPFSPSITVLSLAWVILYLFMGIGAVRICLKADSEMKIYALKTYFWQLVFNWMWGIWFFRQQWFVFSFLWLLMLAVQVVWMMAAFRELDLLAMRLQIPYLVGLFAAMYWNGNALILNR